jgi:hypothetical protein
MPILLADLVAFSVYRRRLQRTVVITLVEGEHLGIPGLNGRIIIITIILLFS